MRIWHVGASSFMHKADGVNAVVWLTAAEQARQGHEVCLLLGVPPHASSTQMAAEAGIELLHAPATRRRYDPLVIEQLLLTRPPQVVHFHSVFVPKQAGLSGRLRELGVAYLITPHGGLSRQAMRRGRIKKALYGALFERPHFRGAAAITLVTPSEERDVRAFIPDYQRPVLPVANPIDSSSLEHRQWPGNNGRHRVVFLGRMDVYHKGLDMFVEIARRVPQAEFHLYGPEDTRNESSLRRLKRTAPANVYFHQPIYGEDKADVLAGATLYLQTSRWEGFSLSVAEAMYVGTPCVINETLGMAETFRDLDLGGTIPLKIEPAAARLSELLRDDVSLRRFSENARSYARGLFHPRLAAANFVQVYQRALASAATHASTDSRFPTMRRAWGA